MIRALAPLGLLVVLVLIAVLMSGCAAEPVRLHYEISEYGIPMPCAGETCRPLSIDEQRAIAVRLLTAYNCPAALIEP